MESIRTNLNIDFRLDFIGIGAPKAGTTWLANNLRKHPDIYIPPRKELVYFNKMMPHRLEVKNPRSTNSLEWYHNFFEGSEAHQITGEISPQYFKDTEVYQRIYNYNPDIKILVMLREPVSRFTSNYHFARQIGQIGSSSMKTAVKKFPYLIDLSLYAERMEKLFDIFPEKNIKVIIFEELVDNHRKVYYDVLQFLKLREFYPKDLDNKANPTGSNRIAYMSSLIRSVIRFFYKQRWWRLRTLLIKLGISKMAGKIIKWNRRGKIKSYKMDAGIEVELRPFFLPDIEKLEKILQKDLSLWKKTTGIDIYKSTGN